MTNIQTTHDVSGKEAVAFKKATVNSSKSDFFLLLCSQNQSGNHVGVTFR